MYTRLKEITHDLSNAPFSVLPAQGAHKNGMAQRWSKDELSSTAREIFIYLKNPEFELKKNYLAFRRDRKLRIPPSSSQITGCLFPSAYFEKVNKSSQTKSNQTNQPSIRTF